MTHLVSFSPLTRYKTWLALAVVFLFLLGGAIRLYDIQKPFVGLLPVREFRSAIIARDFYYRSNPNIPEWQQEVTRASREGEWELEPPILEWLTGITYRLFDRELLWLPRLYASLFWWLGGVVFWQIARRFFDFETTVFLLAYYLFVPIGIIASKSFQPDTLMIMLYLGSLWAILRYDEESSWQNLVWAMLVSAMAVIVRPLCLFAIFGAFTSLVVYRYFAGESKLPSHFLFFGGALLIGTAYYVYSLLFADTLAGQASITFQPHLLLQRDFWLDWIYISFDTLTTVAVTMALLGLAIVRSPRLRWLLLGLWGSHLIYGLVFNYHISTHNYYQLQLIPTVALSSGVLLSFLLDQIRLSDWDRLRRIWLGGICAMFILLALWQVVQHGRVAHNFEGEATAHEIGVLVNHSTRTIYIAPYYGRPLEYFGQLSGQYWPRPVTSMLYRHSAFVEASIGERLANLPYIPEYVIITDFREYNTHHDDLRNYLQACVLVAETSNYLVYEFCQ